MSELFSDPALWLPLVFAALMGLSILIYVIMDGFDLGVGILMPFATSDEKDMMVSSIGPFWDANETWLVMAIGLLLVAFPLAHGAILTALYVPVAVMLIGLILRGVAFEFRAKAPATSKPSWNAAFFAGSLMTALSQGFMLGLYIMGLEITGWTLGFAALTAMFTAIGYSYIGAAWLVLKTHDALQRKAVGWARKGLYGVVLGIGTISIASPMVSARIFDKWFNFPEVLILAPLPLMSLGLIVATWLALRHLPLPNDALVWVPFAAGASLFTLAFAGLAYSFYPYVVPEKITLYEAASAPEALWIILIGAIVVMPVITAYTALSYFVFRGKARLLSYN